MKSKYIKIWRIITISVIACALLFAFCSIMDFKMFYPVSLTRENFFYNGEKIIYTPNESIFVKIADIIFIVDLFALLFSNVMLIVGKIKDKIKIFSKFALNFLTAVLLFIGFGLFYNNYEDDFQPFSSDYSPQFYEFENNSHKIVICEKSWLLGGFGDVYQVYNDNTAWKIGSFTTDDGYRNNGDYKIKWSEGGADITYNDGNKNECTKHFNFAE